MRKPRESHPRQHRLEKSQSISRCAQTSSSYVPHLLDAWAYSVLDALTLQISDSCVQLPANVTSRRNVPFSLSSYKPNSDFSLAHYYIAPASSARLSSLERPRPNLPLFPYTLATISPQTPNHAHGSHTTVSTTPSVYGYTSIFRMLGKGNAMIIRIGAL